MKLNWPTCPNVGDFPRVRGASVQEGIDSTPDRTGLHPYLLRDGQGRPRYWDGEADVPSVT